MAGTWKYSINIFQMKKINVVCSLEWSRFQQQKESPDLSRFKGRGVLFRMQRVNWNYWFVFVLWPSDEVGNVVCKVNLPYPIYFSSFNKSLLSPLDSFLLIFVHSSKNVPKIFQIVTLLFFVVSSIALKALLLCKSLVDQQSIINFSLALGKKKCQTDIHFNDIFSIKWAVP